MIKFSNTRLREADRQYQSMKKQRRIQDSHNNINELESPMQTFKTQYVDPLIENTTECSEAKA